MRIPIVPFDRSWHWTPVKLCPYGEGHARFGRVTIVVTMTWCGHKLSLLCIAQNVRFEIPYKVLYFETPFLIIFKYYAWVSCDISCLMPRRDYVCVCVLLLLLLLLWWWKWVGDGGVTWHLIAFFHLFSALCTYNRGVLDFHRHPKIYSSCFMFDSSMYSN